MLRCRDGPAVVASGPSLRLLSKPLYRPPRLRRARASPSEHWPLRVRTTPSWPRRLATCRPSRAGGCAFFPQRPAGEACFPPAHAQRGPGEGGAPLHRVPGATPRLLCRSWGDALAETSLLALPDDSEVEHVGASGHLGWTRPQRTRLYSQSKRTVHFTKQRKTHGRKCINTMFSK